MDLRLTPEQEMKLEELAQRIGRPKNELVGEAIDRLLEHEEWFAREVGIGLDQVNRGEFVEDAAVLARVRKRLDP